MILQLILKFLDFTLEVVFMGIHLAVGMDIFKLANGRIMHQLSFARVIGKTRILVVSWVMIWALLVVPVMAVLALILRVIVVILDLLLITPMAWKIFRIFIRLIVVFNSYVDGRNLRWISNYQWLIVAFIRRYSSSWGVLWWKICRHWGWFIMRVLGPIWLIWSILESRRTMIPYGAESLDCAPFVKFDYN